jgi:outer membrane protein TolC
MTARRMAALAAAALLAFSPATALAHDFAAMMAASDTLKLTLDDAIQRALNEGEEMRSANAGLSVANGQVREAASDAFPQIRGTVTYGRQFASIFQGSAPDTSQIADIFKNSPFGAINTWTGELTASQLIWAGGRVGAALTAARAYRTSTRATRDETAADIALSTARAYLNAAYAQRVIEITESTLDQARAHLAQVTLYQKQGSQSEYDLIRAQVDAANQEPPVVTAKNLSDLTMFELKRLVNLPLDRPLVLVTELAFSDSLVPVVDDADDDPSARAALTKANADVETRRQLVRVERSRFWPEVTASGTWSQQAFPPTEIPRFDQFHRSINAQLKFDFPIFLGTRTIGAVERAGAELRQAEAQQAEVREQVRIQVARARQEVHRTLADLVARRGTASLAGRAHHLAEVRYRNGLSTQVEVSDARLQLRTAEIQEVDALKDYRLALLELDRALGRKVPTVPRTYEQISASLKNEETDR